MKRIALLVSVALSCAAISPLLATTPAPGDLPPPVAEEGEPPIVKTPVAGMRRDYFTQTFPDAGTFDLELKPSTIASLYRLFDGRTTDLEAQRVTVTCPINIDGQISLFSCTDGGPSGEDRAFALRVVRVLGTADNLPTFRELPPDHAYLERNVILTFDVPALAAPQVDLTTGPMVEPEMVGLTPDRGSVLNSYPSRALRQEAEGDMRVECQIQSDLSLICQALSFDPPEHFDLFERSAIAVFRNATIEPTLKDGTDARGVRWRRKVAFRIPD